MLKDTITHRSLSTPLAIALLLSGVFALAATASAAPYIMQGPMLGAITEHSANIWSRVAGEHNVTIRYSQSATFEDYKETPPTKALASNDYCVTHTIENLIPGSHYYYQVLVDGVPHKDPNQRTKDAFLTAPTASMQPRFSIAFGSGTNTDEDGLQAIWLQVQNARPHAFFWLGENNNIDNLPPAFQAEKYRQQRDVPFLQPLLRAVPQISAWNGAKSTESIETFDRYWANPKNTPTQTTYFNYNYAGVDFFFLDTNSHKGDSSTLLGETQLTWLKNELKNSTGKFKILLSSISWTNAANENNQSWLNFKEERNELFAFIGKQEITGVMLISGSDQQAEINAIPLSQEGNYDLYEMTSSPLAKNPTSDYSYDDTSSISIQEPYTESMNFGLLTFDMSFEDPSVQFQIINVFGESVFPEFQVHSSELSKGIASWESKRSSSPVAFAQ